MTITRVLHAQLSTLRYISAKTFAIGVASVDAVKAEIYRQLLSNGDVYAYVSASKRRQYRNHTDSVAIDSASGDNNDTE